MTGICPHCGYDLAADAPIERDGIVSDPRGDLYWQGARVSLQPAARIILHSLLKAGGAVVSREVLAERSGYDGDSPSNSVSIHLVNIRQAMPGVPIETVHRRGLRWAA